MLEKLKAYCEKEYKQCLQWGGDAEKATDRCYGAVMFCMNNCFDDFNEELGKWWDDEMLPKFRELQSYQYELRHAPNYVNTTGIGAT
jgi:hypothetical protein